MNKGRQLQLTSLLISTTPQSKNRKKQLLKRSFDICFSTSVLTLGLPLYLLLAFLIRCTSKGPALYKQKRVGLNGVPFYCYKFRSMYADADVRLQEILKHDKERLKEWKQNHKLKNDPRITPIGSFLRRSSFDELPQFFNVLKGDLSIVGPRPVVDEEIIAHYGNKAAKILSVRPGITGIWQVSGRSDTDYVTRVAMDEQYIDKHSFWLDLKLIVKTIPCMLFRRGAY